MKYQRSTKSGCKDKRISIWGWCDQSFPSERICCKHFYLRTCTKFAAESGRRFYQYNEDDFSIKVLIFTSFFSFQFRKLTRRILVNSQLFSVSIFMYVYIHTVWKLGSKSSSLYWYKRLYQKRIHTTLI